MKEKERKFKLVARGLFGMGLVFLASPAFAQGSLTGTPMDNLLRTAALYASNPLVGGGSLLALGIGGVQHALSHGERGSHFLWSGGVGLGIAATAKFVPPLLGVTF